MKSKKLNMGDSHLIVDICRQHHFPTADGTPNFGAEIGCFRGETSQKLLEAFPHLTLVMVDQWRGDLPADDPYRLSGDGVATLSQAEQDANREAAERATIFGGMANRRMILNLPSEKAAERVGGRLFDFCFLDACHTLAAVKLDIKSWWPLVRSGGILAGHDFNHPKNNDGRFGVKRAVEELVAEHSLKLNLMGNCWLVVKE